MARLSSDENGKIVQFLESYDEEQYYIEAPKETVHKLIFDETTNKGLVTSIREEMQKYKLIGTALYRDNVPIVVQPDSILQKDLKEYPGLLKKLMADQNLTLSERSIILRVILRKMKEV